RFTSWWAGSALLLFRGDLHHLAVQGIRSVERPVAVHRDAVHTAQAADHLDDFAIPYHLNRVGVDIADIDCVIVADQHAAARGNRPGLDERAVRIEDRDAAVVAVSHDDAAFGIDDHAMGQCELSGPGSVCAADDA